MANELASSPQAGDAADAFEPNTVGLLGIIRILFRWSFVVAPLAALTVWFAFSQSDGIKPEHSAESSILLIGPSEILLEDVDSGEIIIEGVNPLQQLGGTLETVALVTVLSLSDVRIAEQLANEGLTSAYQIGAESRTPIIRFIATDVDPELATATAERLAELAFEDLEGRQDDLNAPEANRIGAQLISVGLSEGPDFAARDRVRLAIAAVGFTIAAASAFFLEGIAELWRRRKRRAAARDADIFRRGLPAGTTSEQLNQAAIGSVDDLLSSEGATLIEVLHLVSGDEDYARNTARDAFAAATASWPLPATTEPITWLYADAIRRASKNPTRKPLRSHEFNDDLWIAVHELPIEPRSVLALAHIAGFADRQIAQVMGVDETAVAQHRQHASDHIADSPDQSLRESTENARSSKDTAKAKATDTNKNTTAAKATDTKATDNKAAEAKATDTKDAAEAKATDTKAADTKDATEPAETKNTPKPSDTKDTNKAAETKNATEAKATDAKDATEPAETKNTPKPSDTKTATKKTAKGSNRTGSTSKRSRKASTGAGNPTTRPPTKR